jgi:hypothetical protein
MLSFQPRGEDIDRVCQSIQKLTRYPPAGLARPAYAAERKEFGRVPHGVCHRHREWAEGD